MTFVCFSANMDLQIIYLLHTIDQSSDKIRFLHVFFINMSQLPAAKKKRYVKTEHQNKRRAFLISSRI